MILYGDAHWDSPWFFTAFVAASEKGIAFETRVLDLDRGEQRNDSFRGAITGRIPAIEHDGFWLAESTAIAEYIDESFEGTPLFPKERRERARARQVMSWLRSDLQALREERPTTTMFFERAKEPLTKHGRAAADKLISVATALIGDRGQLFGDWSIADADLAFTLHRLILNNEDVPQPLRAFATREWQRPSVRAFVDRPR
jgi:glutathione S-transferase